MYTSNYIYIAIKYYISYTYLSLFLFPVTTFLGIRSEKIIATTTSAVCTMGRESQFI